MALLCHTAHLLRLSATLAGANPKEVALKKYELLLILDPARTEDQNTETLDKVDEVIKKYGGTPERRQVIGKRRLAFTINKRRDGYYVCVYFDAPSDILLFNEVDRHCKYSEEILRHLLTKAVVGKSKGDPTKMPEERRYSGPPRGPRGGYDRGGPRPGAPTEEAPAPAAVEAAPEQPAAE